MTLSISDFQRNPRDLRRFRSLSIFLARLTQQTLEARRQAIALPPEACKQYLLSDFPLLWGPKATRIVQRLAELHEESGVPVNKSELEASNGYSHMGWVAVTDRYPGAQPYTWSRNVLALLDTGGIVVTSFFNHQNLEGEWAGLDEGAGIVTHWHELPVVPHPSHETPTNKKAQQRIEPNTPLTFQEVKEPVPVSQKVWI